MTRYDAYDKSELYRESHRLRSSLSKLDVSVTAYTVITLIVIYYVWHYLDHINLSFSRCLWNIFVYMVPSSLLARFDVTYAESRSDRHSKSMETMATQTAAKGAAIRRAMGLSDGGLLQAVQRARRLSGLGAAMRSVPSAEDPPGLGNWDNSCYQNSVLQGLASLGFLPAFLQGRNGSKDDSTSEALRILTTQLNEAQNAGKTLWTPAKLKNMSSWQQQDAQEYFSKMIDEVEKDITKSLKKSRSNHGLQELASASPSSSMTSHATTPGNPAIQHVGKKSLCSPNIKTLAGHTNPIEGHLAQRVGCQKCGFVEGLSLVPFNCLTVPLGTEAHYDIQSCLDDFTALEPIRDVECARCTLLQVEEKLMAMSKTINCGVKHSANEKKDLDTKQDLSRSVRERLSTIQCSLKAQEFSESALKKAQVGKNRVLTTKSRQAVIARLPKVLVIHVNRSQFNEMTGAQSKNYASVKFPARLDLEPWCLGSSVLDTETWNTNPIESMLAPRDSYNGTEHGTFPKSNYDLRAVVTHSGRHENGHYICYRRLRMPRPDSEAQDREKATTQSWYRLNDETVTEVPEQTVLGQGGVFMLFYEQHDSPRPPFLESPTAASGRFSCLATEDEVIQRLVASVQNNSEGLQTKTDESFTDTSDSIRPTKLLGNPSASLSQIECPDSLSNEQARVSPRLEDFDTGSPGPNLEVATKVAHPTTVQISPKASLQMPTTSTTSLTPRSGRSRGGGAGQPMESMATFVQAN